MSLQLWEELLVNQVDTGTSFGTFTTAKTVINAQALYVIPAGFFHVGKKLRISVSGGMGSLVTTPGLVAFQVMIGSVIAFTTGNVQLNATAHTNLPFKLVLELTCRTVGSGTGAVLMGTGVLSGIMFTLTAAQVDAPNTSGMFMVPVTAPANGTGFDSTIANILDFFVGFTISNAANTVRIEQYEVESLN